MSTFETHCNTCQQKLGDAFVEVNLWLDEFHGKPPYGTRHRHLRHHRQGIEEVRKKWGDFAALAAEVHIREDLTVEGWPEEQTIPEDGEAFKNAGLW